MITGIINTKLKIAGLLAGILTMTSLYSINLRIMGRSLIPLFRERKIFDAFEWLFGSNYVVLLTLILIVLIIKILLDYFLHTELGMALRATGDNPVMIETLGVNTDLIQDIGPGPCQWPGCPFRCPYGPVLFFRQCPDGHGDDCCGPGLSNYRRGFSSVPVKYLLLPLGSSSVRSSTVLP